MYRFKPTKNNKWIIEKRLGAWGLYMWIAIKEKDSFFDMLPSDNMFATPKVKEFDSEEEAKEWLKKRGGSSPLIVEKNT